MNRLISDEGIWSSKTVSKTKAYKIDSILEHGGKKLKTYQSYVAYSSTNPGQSKAGKVATSKFLAIAEKESCAQKLQGAEACVDAEKIGQFIKYKLSLRDHNSAQHLLEVSKKIPQKGSNGPIQIEWYKSQFGVSSLVAGARAARDFFSSFYFFQFTDVPSLNHDLLDICGSLFCITMAADYVLTADEQKWGGLEIFTASACDGFDFILNPPEMLDAEVDHLPTVFDDLVKVSAYILLRKMFETSDSSSDSMHQKIKDAVAKLIVSPARYLELRWWDAAMVPYHRVLMGFAKDFILCDSVGTPLCAVLCLRIKRAMDSLIRYNETIDVTSDIRSSEAFNEVLLAFAIGGVRVVKHYAIALAAVIEDVISCAACTATEADHKWAADLALGAVVIYAIAPRYQTILQVSHAVEWQTQNSPPPATRGHFLPGVSLVCKLEGIAELHKENWEPAWFFPPNDSNTIKTQVSKCSPCELAAFYICRRILRQDPTTFDKGRAVMGIIYDVIVDPEWHQRIDYESTKKDDGHCVPFNPEEYPQIWHRLCMRLYNYGCQTIKSGDEAKTAADALGSLCELYCKVIWKNASIKMTETTQLDEGATLQNEEHYLSSISVQLYTTLDNIIRRTHFSSDEYGDGAWRRHVVIGLGASFLEFSPVSAYDRIIKYAFGVHQ